MNHDFRYNPQTLVIGLRSMVTDRQSSRVLSPTLPACLCLLCKQRHDSSYGATHLTLKTSTHHHMRLATIFHMGKTEAWGLVKHG